LFLHTNKSTANTFLFLGPSCLCIDWHAEDTHLWELTASAVMRSINNSTALKPTYLNSNILVKLSLYFMGVQSTGEAEKKNCFLRADFSLFAWTGVRWMWVQRAALRESW